MATSIASSQMPSSQGNSRLFEGESHASAYKEYRPRYETTDLMEKILMFLQEKLAPPYECALDLGCGSGQSSRHLIPHFTKVIGVDCSEAQIKAALETPELKNVSFRCGDERNLGFIPDNSLELVTCGQSIHWMDLDALYPEIDRILKPGGCLAAYGYVSVTPHVIDGDTVLEREIQSLYKEINDWIQPLYSEKVNVLFGGYTALPLPYSDQRRMSGMKFYKEVTVESLLGLFRSFSAYQTAMKKFPEKSNILEEYKQKFLDTISKVSANPESYKMKFAYDLCLVMSRKPSIS